jgi:hypothetical protein
MAANFKHAMITSIENNELQDNRSHQHTPDSNSKLSADELTAQLDEHDLTSLMQAHTDITRTIIDSLLHLVPSSVTPAVLHLSVQDQLALLHRLSDEAHSDLPGCHETLTVMVACSLALAVSDSVIFKSISAPTETSPRVIQEAALALESSMAQLESLLPAIPASSSLGLQPDPGAGNAKR